MWDQLHPLGRLSDGGYGRYAWTRVDAALREWFVGQAQARGLAVDQDRAGNLWAWWGEPDAAVRAGRPGVVMGSHLDSVRSGGAFDGPLGVVSALAVLDRLQACDRAGPPGQVPARPVGVVVMAEEEGARFGVACAGSRLLTGALHPDRARGLRDDEGTTLAEAAAAAGTDVRHLGADPVALGRVGTFVELHVEQGRGLVHLDRAVAVGSGIWPHGRWRVDVAGRADHAGTTALPDRDDPVLALARVVLEARRAAEQHGCLATVGRLEVRPGSVNGIASRATAWLDARGPDETDVRRVVAAVAAAAGSAPVEESFTPATGFDEALVDRAALLLDGAPVLATGAGHDAGVLAGAGVPSLMLFVRNPTGVSHSPAEHAEADDCAAGVDALETVVRDLRGAPGTRS
jgi:N-carbamoyl-L-amino-acid hydrolase